MSDDNEVPEEVKLQWESEARITDFIAKELQSVPKEWLETICDNMLDDFHWLLRQYKKMPEEDAKLSC